MINGRNDVGSSCFPTTEWTLVLEVIKTGEPAVAWEALSRFCIRYRPAIRNFFLRRRLSWEQAEDYTHAFFASRVFEKWDSRKDFLHKAERRKGGQFRGFLAAILWQFLYDEQRRQRSLKAGAQSLHISISDPDVYIEDIGEESFEGFGREFDRELALEIIQRAASGSNNSKYHLAHLRGEISQAEAARELGISENSFKQAHHRFRKRLTGAIWAEVSKLTGPDKAEIEEEIRYLMSLFA